MLVIPLIRTYVVLILVLIISSIEFLMLLINFNIQSVLVTISIILLIIISLVDGIEREKAKGLIYPLIVVYFLIGLPFIGNLVSNKIIYIGIAVVSFIATVIFIFYKVIST